MVTLVVVVFLGVLVVLWGLLTPSLPPKKPRQGPKPPRPPERPKPPAAPKAPEPAAPPIVTGDDTHAAIHEAGHAVTSWACTMVAHVRRVSIDNDRFEGIDPEWRAYTLRTDYRLTSSEADRTWCELVIHLGGIAAVARVRGRVSTAPFRIDLQHARECARKILSLGSADPPWHRLGAFDKRLPFDAMFADLSEGERTVIERGYFKARAVLGQHQVRLSKLISALLTRRTLREVDIDAVLGPRTFVVRNLVVNLIRLRPAKAWFYMGEDARVDVHVSDL